MTAKLGSAGKRYALDYNHSGRRHHLSALSSRELQDMLRAISDGEASSVIIILADGAVIHLRSERLLLAEFAKIMGWRRKVREGVYYAEPRHSDTVSES